MILIVNVGKSLRRGVPLMQATERAWALSLVKCKQCDFVVPVGIGGIVQGCFKILAVFPDKVDPKRVAFDLRPCTPEEQAYVSGIIGPGPFGGVQRGLYL